MPTANTWLFPRYHLPVLLPFSLGARQAGRRATQPAPGWYERLPLFGKQKQYIKIGQEQPLCAHQGIPISAAPDTIFRLRGCGLNGAVCPRGKPLLLSIHFGVSSKKAWIPLPLLWEAYLGHRQTPTLPWRGACNLQRREV